MEKHTLRRTVLVRFGGGVVVLGILFFLPAGTIRWWEAWLFLATLFVPMAFVARYLFRNDPALLERRMEHGEERGQQKAIVKATSALWLLTFLIPGLDHRFGWSSVPAWLVVLADALVLVGYLIFFLTVRENSFAARTIRVEEGQHVISTGPYAVVRHPMYVGLSLMMLFAPLALGSWWAVIPALTTPPSLMLRIVDEEKAMMAGLPGYAEYAHTVRWRLFPGVW
ncbi:MAG TPA: isoprenylcysteine carboxylmethyltransferase family protein [Longimicrobiales bacterium]|nr:isoprenylcysteine carboxylmethyltransferase family protein [Longimicrobiales bacterium]